MAQTINQVLKAITAYAKKHNETYLEVRHSITLEHSGKLTHRYEAYINGFGIYAQGDNIAELIEKFDQTAQEPKTDAPIDLDLPF